MTASLQDARPLKIGLVLPHWTGSMAGETPRWADMLALARRAEEVGFDSVWIVDGLLIRVEEGDPLGYWECWSLLSAIAASTSRVELGSLVASNLFRNPVLLAKMADAVDEISGGRLILGLGAGEPEGQHRDLGFPWEHRFGRLEEALTILRGLLRDGYVDVAGRHYQAREVELRPRGPRPNGPPIMLGTEANGPRMLRLTAQFGDIWNIWLAWGRSTPDVIPPLRTAVDAACLANHRDPATLLRSVTAGVALPGHELWFGPWDISAGALTGSPEELAAAFRAFADEGISHVQVYLAPNTLDGIEAFAPVLDLLGRPVAAEVLSD